MDHLIRLEIESWKNTLKLNTLLLPENFVTDVVKDHIQSIYCYYDNYEVCINVIRRRNLEMLYIHKRYIFAMKFVSERTFEKCCQMYTNLHLQTYNGRCCIGMHGT